MLRIPEQDGTFDKALLSYSESTGESHSYVNPAVWNPLAEAGRVMRCNPREVALSSASRDNSTRKLHCTLFLKLGSHYYMEPTAPAGACSTYFKIIITN